MPLSNRSATNSDRAEWAEQAVDAHTEIVKNDEEPMVDRIRDLMCNLLHLARMEDIDTQELMRTAHDLFEEEVEEDED